MTGPDTGGVPAGPSTTDATVDSQTTPSDIPPPSDQGGLSSDVGSTSRDLGTDDSIRDQHDGSERPLPGGEDAGTLPNTDPSKTDELGRLHPKTAPMSNDNR